MAVETLISHRLGILTSDEKEQIIAFLKKSKLLEKCPKLSSDKIIEEQFLTKNLEKG